MTTAELLDRADKLLNEYARQCDTYRRISSTAMQQQLFAGQIEAIDAWKRDRAALKPEALTDTDKQAIEEYRQFVKMRQSLNNISMFARREKRKAGIGIQAETWGHIVRFCEEAGLAPSVLRGAGEMSDPRLLSKEQRGEITMRIERSGRPITINEYNLLAHAEAVGESLVEAESELKTRAAIARVKEMELVAAGEFFAGAGYTGELNYDAGKAWAFLLDSVRAQAAEKGQRITVLEATVLCERKINSEIDCLRLNQQERIVMLEATLEKIVAHEHAMACRYSVDEQSWVNEARAALGGKPADGGKS